MKLLSILYYSQVVQRLKSDRTREMADNLLYNGACAGVRPDDPKYVVCADCPLRVHTIRGVMCLHAIDTNAIALLRKMCTREGICS